MWGSDEDRWQRTQMESPVCGHSLSQRLARNFLVYLSLCSITKLWYFTTFYVASDLFSPGEVHTASAHLCQVFGQEPRDAAAQARVGVVEAMKQKHCSAARRLSRLAEKDSSSLDFLLSLIPVSQKKNMAQVSTCARGY